MTASLPIATSLVLVISLTYLAVVASCVLWMTLRHGARREQAAEDLDTVAVSRFTIPVSLIVVANRETDDLSDAVKHLLALNYPEFEVIVVSDAADRHLQVLKGSWELEAREFFFRQALTTSPISRIYRSASDKRLTLLIKEGTGRSDAINCGVNVARFRYVGVVDARVRFDADALLRAMAAAQRDPATVVGVSSHVERSATARDGFMAAFGRLASMRAIMESRLVWRGLDGAVGPTDAVVIWRRDAVLGAGGFSTDAPNGTLDMMCRLQSSAEGPRHRVVRNPDVFGQAATASLSEAMNEVRAREGAALAILTAWLTRSSTGFRDRRIGTYVMLSEVATPVAQALAVLASVSGSAAGWFPWWHSMAVLFILSFGNAVVSSAALLLRGVSSGSPEGAETARLLMLAPLDFLCYRPALAWARITGVWSAFKPSALRPAASASR